MSVIKRLWWFFKLEKKRYVLGIMALVLVSILNLVPPMAMGAIIDRIDLQTVTMSSLLWDVLLILIAAISMYALRFLWRQYIIGTSNKLGRLLRSQLFKHFTKMSPSFYQHYRTGDLMAHATNDVRVVTMLAGPGVMSAVDASMTALVTIITMFFGISWQLAVLAILPLPVMSYLTNRVNKKSYTSVLQSQEAFSDLNNKVQESIAGIKVIKSFGYQDDDKEDFAQVNEMTFQKNMKMTRLLALYDPVTGSCIAASYTITLLFGGYLISQNQLTLGGLITFVTYLDMLVWPLKASGFLVNMIQRGNVAYERIERILSYNSDIVDVELSPQQFALDDITFDINTFAFDTVPTVKDIRFTLKKGQTLGIVGPTGSGKTTLIKLLLREHDIKEGVIKIGEHNITDVKLSDLRDLIGYVPQDQILFATTILENIRFSNPELLIEDVKRVAQLCCVAEDIENMPNQYNTVIGERGVSLSGGQKQRIAMARAFIKNPDILILDDSLSAIDAKTESQIVTNLQHNRQNKTTIITAHRLSAVSHSDLILVINNGEIVESGTHNELMAINGWYANMYVLQQLESERNNVE